MIEFWKKEATEELRRASLILDLRPLVQPIRST